MALKALKNVRRPEFPALLNAPGVLVVKFFATWCGPCKMYGPLVEQVAQELQGQATFVGANIDQDGGIASSYGIQSVPATLVFRDGQEVARKVGLVKPADLRALIQPHLPQT